VEWELLTIKIAPYFVFTQITSIASFAENDIWLGTNIPYHWDGNQWRGYFPEDGWEDEWNFSGYIRKMWGTSSSNLYFIGNVGSIVHYDGSSFTKLESGTEKPIIDIWGLDENHVWATAYTNTIDNEHPSGYESVTLYYNGTEWVKKYVSTTYFPVYTDSISSWMFSAWAYGDTVYITCEGGLWKESITTGQGTFLNQSTLGFDEWHLNQVRGNGYNDLFLLSGWGQIAHYNGNSWRVILDLTSQFPDPPPFSWRLDVKGDMVTFCGIFNLSEKALIVRGQR